MIDEKILIKRLQDCVAASDNSNFTNGLLSAIDIIGRQDRIGNWIPCNERLPNVDEYGYGDFIVTIKGASEATELTYYESNKSWTDGIGNYYEVIAWQPFPKGYKENPEAVKNFADKRRFPILKTKESIPWEVVEKHRLQALVNHQQTIERLAERGGLSWYEMYYVINDIHFNTKLNISEEESKQKVLEIIKSEEAAK